MAGRGVDIKLGGAHATAEEREAVRGLGGLFVLGTERHEARRIDDQLRGRSGRQGDPGETQFFVSMEDSLMRVFAADTVKSMMGRLGIPEDQPIENALITRSLESAQRKIEGFNFDARKHVLAYDDVLNRQRQAIYRRRREILLGSHEEIEAALQEVVAEVPDVAAVISEKRTALGDAAWYAAARRLLLQISDALWVEHLELMDYTRGSVNLRAYGQRDPLIEYRKEASRLFEEMQQAARIRVAEILPRVGEKVPDDEERELRAVQKNARLIGGGEKGEERQVASPAAPQFGRNDLVTITNGTETREIKFKKAEALLASGWRILK
jgi:preprotein translocase subunit SecA